jgi:hypothetical protein
MGQDPSLRYYAEGFFEAGEELAQSCLANRGKVDFKFYPLLFLYRHGIELALKQLIRWQAEFSGTALKPGQPKGHDNLALWAMIDQTCECFFEDGLHQPDFPFQVAYSVEEVSAILEDIETLAAGGFGFRYPKNIAGEVLLADTDSLCVKTVNDTLVPLGRTLDAWMHAARDVVEAVQYGRRERKQAESAAGRELP